MNKVIRGKVHKFGRDIDTDVIIPARYLTTFDPLELGRHCFADLDESFATRVSEGDIIVAGENFGCGSSREHAPIAIKGAGISAVVAESFARIFLRNSINIGLTVVEAPGITNFVEDGDEIEIDLENGKIRNLTRDREMNFQPLPSFLKQIIDAGGLIEFAKERLKTR
ncbi:MAG: 3-isopropylmalate dehydratase small subunit [Actinobacteria bacterium]|nr:3-isopropylmalate dehydratase small subunit [Actinomycetota bacterium]